MGSLTWSTRDIGDLSGRVLIVTGGNSGLGFEAARELALHGGHVIIATHGQHPGSAMPADEVDGPGAVSKIKGEQPDAAVEYLELDLSSFKSIRQFVQAFKAKGLPFHCLINNAGLQTPPDATSEDGFEITLGINFFGPFLLTQLLLDDLKRQAGATSSGGGGAPGPRIVWMSSPAETLGETDWDDLKGLKRGTNMRQYGTSKLWNLMMAMEMNDRLKGSGVESFAVHPGLARTDLFRKGDDSKPATRITDWAQWLTGQSAASGALSALYAATSPDLEGKGGSFFGPLYVGGAPLNICNTSSLSPGNPEARDPAARARLFDEATRVVNEVVSQLEAGGSMAAPGGVTAATGGDAPRYTAEADTPPPAPIDEPGDEPRYEPKPAHAGRTLSSAEGPGLESVGHLKAALEDVGVVLTGPVGVAHARADELGQLGEAAAKEAAGQGGGAPAAAAPAGEA